MIIPAFSTTRLRPIARSIPLDLLLIVSLFTNRLQGQQLSAKQLMPALLSWQQQAYLHLNKSFFVAGEPIRFSLTTLDVLQRQPAGFEQTAFLELFSANGTAVLQTTFPLRQGSGAGSWLIPDTVSTGNYLVRAYTAAMRNQGPAAFATSAVTIVNTAQQPAWSELEQPDSLVLRFYPEGGRLVAGLPTQMAVWLGNQYGEGWSAQGTLVNQRGDTLAKFTTCCGGRALLNWTPNANEQYRVVVQAENGSRTTVAVPTAATEGTILIAKNVAAQKVSMQVVASPQYNGQTLYLLAGTVQALTLQNGSASVELEAAALPKGLFPISLYDTAGTLLAQRWWYRLTSETVTSAANVSQSSYPTRHEVKVGLATSGPGGVGIPARMAVSVFRVDSLQRALGLAAANDRDGTEATDLWLRTIGLPWRGVEGPPTLPTQVHLPNFEGTRITAAVHGEPGGRAAGGVRAFLAVPGRQFQFVPAVSGNNGLVQFSVGKMPEVQRGIMLPADSGFTITPLPVFEPTPSAIALPRFKLPGTWVSQLEQHSVAAQVQAAFNPIQRANSQRPAVDTTAFYGKPDKTYLLDEYTRFPTMEEVLREYVPEVLVRKRGGNFVARVYNTPYGSFFEDQPLMLLDGVPLFDGDQLMSIDPLKVQRLEVVSRRFARGSDVYAGIISLGTYKGTAEAVPTTRNAKTLLVPGMLPDLTFPVAQYGPDQPKTNRVPDQRLQLYWHPGLETGTDGRTTFSFFTSDVPGRYAIVVKAIGTNGVSSSQVSYIDVVR